MFFDDPLIFASTSAFERCFFEHQRNLRDSFILYESHKYDFIVLNRKIINQVTLGTNTFTNF